MLVAKHVPAVDRALVVCGPAGGSEPRPEFLMLVSGMITIGYSDRYISKDNGLNIVHILRG